MEQTPDGGEATNRCGELVRLLDEAKILGEEAVKNAMRNPAQLIELDKLIFGNWRKAESVESPEATTEDYVIDLNPTLAD